MSSAKMAAILFQSGCVTGMREQALTATLRILLPGTRFTRINFNHSMDN